MNGSEILLQPEQCVLLLVDFQAGLAFGVESVPRQILLNKRHCDGPHGSRFRCSGGCFHVRLACL